MGIGETWMYWKKMGLLTLVYQNPPSWTHSTSPLISSKQSSSRLAKNMTVTDEWISISREKKWRSPKGRLAYWWCERRSAGTQDREGWFKGREGFEEYITNWILTLSTGCRADLGRNCNNEGFQQRWFQVCRRTGFTVCVGDGLRGAGNIDCRSQFKSG